MRTFAAFFLGACLAAGSGPAPRAKGWRGIVPLHSTREDVRQLIGKPRSSGPLHDSYELKKESVEFFYSDGPCRVERRGGWNVPRGTVVSITVTPAGDVKVADLRLDPKKYQRARDGELPGIYSYTNEEDGITVIESEGEVTNIHYNPVAGDEHLACPE